MTPETAIKRNLAFSNEVAVFEWHLDNELRKLIKNTLALSKSKQYFRQQIDSLAEPIDVDVCDQS